MAMAGYKLLDREGNICINEGQELTASTDRQVARVIKSYVHDAVIKASNELFELGLNADLTAGVNIAHMERMLALFADLQFDLRDTALKFLTDSAMNDARQGYYELNPWTSSKHWSEP